MMKCFDSGPDLGQTMPEEMNFKRYVYVYFDPAPQPGAPFVYAGAGFVDCPDDWDQATVILGIKKTRGLDAPGVPGVILTIFEADVYKCFMARPGQDVQELPLELAPSEFVIRLN